MKKTKIFLAGMAMIAAGVAAQAQEQSPRYVFYFIGDGMGVAQVHTTEMYNRATGAPSLTMLGFPQSTLAMTFSASSPITDSAAAGTALSTGHKTRNGMLGMDADTISVNSVARVLKDNGFGVGIVTSVAPDDATPGAFYAHVPKRSMYYEIGRQAAECGYEFIAGAGLRGLTDKQGNPTGLENYLADNGVSVVYGLEELEALGSAPRVMLLNTREYALSEPNNISYTIDSVPGVLNLPDITRACLAQMEAVSPDRFFMMVEGGNIDHAAHGNDGGAVVKEVKNFDQAIAIAYDFYLQHPEETLIVITADHETGGMSLANGYLKYDAKLALIDHQRVSKEQFSEYCKGILKSRRVYTWDDMREYLADNLGLFGAIPVSEQQEAELREGFEKTFMLRNSDDQKTLYASFNAFATDVFKLFNDMVGIGFTSTSHSGNPVPVFAVGVGADRFSGYLNNTNIPERILEVTLGNK